MKISSMSVVACLAIVLALTPHLDDDTTLKGVETILRVVQVVALLKEKSRAEKKRGE